MATIRDMFHEIGNWHNKISVGAGVTKATLEQKLKNNSEETKYIFDRLTEIEKLAIGADKVLNELKNIIYAAVDPDTGKPKK